MKAPVNTLIASCLFLLLVNSGTLAVDMDKRPGGQGSASAGGYSGRAVGGHPISLPSRSSVSLPGRSVVRSVPGVSQHPMIQMRQVVRPNALPASRQQIATVRPQIPGIQPPAASFRPRVSTIRPQVQTLTPNRQAVQSGGLPSGVTYAGPGNPLPVGVTYANPGHLTTGSINHNFRNGLNWSTDRHHWGYNPWWNRSAVRPWYGGFWNCGWNNDYYHHLCRIGLGPWPGYACCVDDDYGYCPTSGWGLCGWGLGNLLYDSGYLSYCNPYFAAPVPIAGGDQVGYTEPLASVAVRTTPNDGDVSKMTCESELWVGQSQAAFKQRDYLRALELADKAVAAAPGDGALHEYRALVLFALGNYAEAAGVLNPVLAGGPGWNWTTMIALYDSRLTYASQLESLEGYAKAKPRAADIHFLLGYHYMVGGKIAMANGEFALAAKLQPADTISAQLRDLTNASINGGGDKPAASEVVPVPPPAPLSVQKLEGTWIADKGAQGTVTLILKDGGKFVWTFDNAGHSNDFSGAVSLELDIPRFVSRQLGVPVTWVLAAYNRFTPYRVSGVNSTVWLFGFESIYPKRFLETTPKPDVRVFIRDAKEPKLHFAVEARYLIREMSGAGIHYRMGTIADSEGRALVAARAISPSPFPGDNALFIGGFDCNDQPSHSTGWIYRGKIKITK